MLQSSPSSSLNSGPVSALVLNLLRTKKWFPRWGSENVPVKRRMWEAITNKAPSFEDVLMIRVMTALWCDMIEVTMPCIDCSCSGVHRGEWGDTGWLWVYVIRLALAIGPTVIFSEMADYAMMVDGGQTIKRILAALAVKYFVMTDCGE